MSEYNLTQRERQIVTRLLELSQHSKELFEARTNPAATGPSRDLATLDFGGEGHSMDLTKRDLRVLKDEGFLHFRWNRPDRGIGRLSSLAFAAVTSNFQEPPDAAEVAALALAASELAVAEDEKAIALRFGKISAELVELAGRLIDADEAVAARHEALSIAEQLKNDVPDEAILTRKIKGFVTRLALTFSGTADLAEKGEMIGEFGERLAAWLVALSIWTEWHAAHHPVPTA
jgi:hypothetical protein